LKTLFVSLAAVSTLVTVLVALLAIIKNKSFKGNRNFFLLYFILSALIDIASMVMFYKGIHNVVLVNAFSILQLFLLSMALIPLLPNSVNRKTVYGLMVAIILFSLYRRFLIGIIDVLDLPVFTIHSVFLIVLSAMILYKLSSEIEIPLLKNPDFWFCVSIFFYFLIGSIVFSATNFIVAKESTAMSYLWIINNLISIAANSFYLIAIRCLPKAAI
jgi:hypothetical protein